MYSQFEIFGLQRQPSVPDFQQQQEQQQYDEFCENFHLEHDSVMDLSEMGLSESFCICAGTKDLKMPPKFKDLRDSFLQVEMDEPIVPEEVAQMSTQLTEEEVLEEAKSVQREPSLHEHENVLAEICFDSKAIKK